MPIDKRYRVMIDDNFNFMDESERSQLGEFETSDEAIAVCHQIVDSDLQSMFRPGMSAEELYDCYTRFGSDPFIVATPPNSEEAECSAWDYAKSRCEWIMLKNVSSRTND